MQGPGRDETLGWLASGYAGLGGFFVLEKLFRRPGDAARLKRSDGDRGTTMLIVATYAVAVDIPLVARRRASRPLPPAVAPAGLALQAAGLVLRAWSMRSLGRFYSRRLRAEDHQEEVDTGPYRLIRHPGYLGSLLIWAGFAMTSRSVPVVALVPAMLVAAYRRRISTEEQLLRRDVPGYASYSRRTKRLIPFVW